MLASRAVLEGMSVVSKLQLVLSSHPNLSIHSSNDVNHAPHAVPSFGCSTEKDARREYIAYICMSSLTPSFPHHNLVKCTNHTAVCPKQRVKRSTLPVIRFCNTKLTPYSSRCWCRRRKCLPNSGPAPLRTAGVNGQNSNDPICA